MDAGTLCYRHYCEEGDQSAFTELVCTYGDGLLLYLNTLVGDLGAAEELTEDTFVVLGLKRPKDKGGASFKTWLYTIGRNLAIDHLRKEKRHPSSVMEDCSPAVETVESRYLQNEEKQILHHAISRLKWDYRQVLWLIYFENFSQKEAATVLKKNVHAVETLVYRARNALREQLEKEGYSHERI